MDEWQPQCKYDIAETCCSSISIDQLQELSEDKSANVLQPAKKLDYGEIRGSNELRSNLARLYSSKGGMWNHFCYLMCHESLSNRSLRQPINSRQYLDHSRCYSRKSSRLLFSHRTWRPCDMSLSDLPAALCDSCFAWCRSRSLESGSGEKMDT
jgi:hypothetical protein